jgi:hypothetical protein
MMVRSGLRSVNAGEGLACTSWVTLKRSWSSNLDAKVVQLPHTCMIAPVNNKHNAIYNDPGMPISSNQGTSRGL